MTIKIPSKSILDRPTLNISNDNILKNIEYTQQNRYEKWSEIGNLQVQYCEQTPVTKNATINGENVLSYSPFIEDYKIFKDSNNNISPKISNSNFSFICQCIQSEVDDSTIKSPYIRNLLIKGTFAKSQTNIDYKQIIMATESNSNNYQIWVKGSLYVEASGFMQNAKQTNDGYPSIQRKYVSFSSEQEALDYLLFYNSNLKQYVVRNSRITDIVVVDKNDSFDLYFLIFSYSERISSSEYLLDEITNDCFITFYAKQIDSNSTTINENSKYSLPDNELLSTTTTISSEDIYTVINNSIAREFGKGKHSIDLTCLYMEYKDTDGNVVYNGKDGNTISIGDEIEPYYYTDNCDKPIGTYPDGNPLQFVVYSSELESNDGVYIKNHIKGIEKTQNQYLKVKVADDYTSSDKTKTYNLPINDEVIATYGNDIGDIIDGLIPDVDSQNIPARARTLSVEVNTTMELETNQNSFRKVVITDNGITQYRGKIMAFQIPESSNVTIGQYTFNPTNLYRVGVNINSETNILPSSVRLSSGCFQNTQLQNITIPATIVEIPSSCFRNCPLTSAVLGKKTGWYTSLVYSNDELKNWIDMRNPSTAATYLKSTYANDTLYWHSTVQGHMSSWKAGYVLDTTVGSQLNYVSNGSWTSFNGTIDVPPGASTISWDTLNFMNTYDSSGKLLRPQLWNAGTTYNLNSTDKLICGSILNANYTGDVEITFSFEE